MTRIKFSSEKYHLKLSNKVGFWLQPSIYGPYRVTFLEGENTLLEELFGDNLKESRIGKYYLPFYLKAVDIHKDWCIFVGYGCNDDIHIIKTDW